MATDTSSGISVSSPMVFLLPPSLRCSRPAFYCPIPAARASVHLLLTHRERAMPVAPLQDVLSRAVCCFFATYTSPCSLPPSPPLLASSLSPASSQLRFATAARVTPFLHLAHTRASFCMTPRQTAGSRGASRV